MTRHTNAVSGEAGFTLIEMLVVVGVMSILAGVSAWSLTGAVENARADSAMTQVASVLRQGRDAALGEGRTVEVTFIAPNRIALVRDELPRGRTTIAEIALENGAHFEHAPALPDTPDHFGANADVDFGGAATVEFTADGTLADGNGVPLNGTVFVAIPHQPNSARAITVTGASARAQAYRWIGSRWEAH